MKPRDEGANIDAFDLVASVIKRRREELTLESSIVNTPGWDSLAQVEIMTFLSDAYGIELTEETITKFSRLGAIEQLMQGTRG